jgi:CMP-N,N'-diacetyllegionaminic acid synthase
MEILCTICARSGSKGLKNKNFLKIKGKTLLSHTLSQAIKIKKINNIIISSDSNKIKKIKNKKIIHLVRSKKLSGNKIGKLAVIRNALNNAEKIFKKKFDTVIDLDVTSPLRKLSDINSAINLFYKKNYNNLITICEARKNPYFNMVEKKKNKIDLVKKKNIFFKSRQAAPKVYELNASIYLWKRKYLLKNDNLFSNKTVYYKMPYNRSIDIDNLTDYNFVKFLMKKND